MAQEGTISAEDQVSCKTCHAPIHRLAEICPKCGVRQRGKPADKAILLLITFFLGGIGMHKFYVKKYGWGTVYLLLSWTGVPSLIALIEFFIYLFTSAEKIEEKYSATGSAIIIVIVAIAYFIAVIGILAAIAIPSYHSYVVRAKVSQAIDLGKSTTLKMEKFYLKNNRYPGNAGELGLGSNHSGKHIKNLEVTRDGLVIITFSDNTGMAAGKTIIYQKIIRDGHAMWDCRGGTLPLRLRTPDCR